MRFLIYGVSLALAACSGGFASQPNLQGKMPGKGVVVEGTVTTQGKPASGVIILLRSTDEEGRPAPSLKAKSDQEGKYRIIGVPSGSYYVAPANPVFVVANANDFRGHTLVVVVGETVEAVDLELTRGGVIAGRAVDVDGRPIIEQPVFLLDVDLRRNQRRSAYANRTMTDDRGVYRIFGIPAGRYKIGIGQVRQFPARPSSNFIPTFYPDVSEESKATIVDVNEDSEVSNINITVGRAPDTFAVSGRVIDGENGQPIAGARFGLQKTIGGGQSSYVGNLTTSNSNGEFKLDNLLPGKYGIFLVPEANNRLRSKVVLFEIVDQDVTGILIKTATGGASLAGVVVLENSEDKTVLRRLTQLHVYGRMRNSDSGSNIGLSSSISADGSFSFDNLEPGSFDLSLGGPNLSMKGFNVWRVERNGMVEANGIEVKSGDRITDIRVVVSYGTATLHGVVKLDKGMLPIGAQISVRVLKDGTDTNLGSDVDGRGRFIIEGIPAGLYILETSLYVPGTAVRPGSAVKLEVNVAEGLVTEVIITLKNPRPSSNLP